MVLYLQRFFFFFFFFLSLIHLKYIQECMVLFYKNIRKECESIYHVIERLANSKMKPIHINYSLDGIKEARKRILNSSAKVSNELIRLTSSSSSSHRSVSTSNSWTRDLVSQWDIHQLRKIECLF
jgi:hypothetical protein